MIKDKKKLILSLLMDVLIFVLCLLSFRIVGTKYIFVYGALLIGLNALYFINEDVRKKILLLYFQTIVIIVVSIFTALFLPNATILLPISVIFIFSLYLLVVSKKANTVFNFIIKYRYLIALAIFVICVCFQVHGSSVSWYEVAMGTGNPYDNELFGAARAIRTDEFNVQLPYYFSQYYNDYQQISYQMSISGQDMILGYNAPVINLLLIGKPFTWGYILFGNAYGLSWYWMSKLLLGMLVYFEVSKILTKNNLISFFGMFYVVFSPAMQWWFCPHMYDVFFWGAALLAIGYHFFIGDEKWKKVLTTVLAIQAFICFIIALFPSLQVSVGLMAVAILIATLVRDRKEISFNKVDIVRVIIVAVVVCLVVGSYLIPALDEIMKTSSTVYPGSRASLGGDRNFIDLFSNLMCYLTPFKDSSFTDNCAVSTFNHFGLFCIMLYPFLFFNKRIKDRKDLIVGGTFFVVLLIQIEFMLFGFPEWLAKITLFSYINRMNLAYGLTASLFTIWTINFLVKNRESIQKPLFAILILVYSLLNYVALREEYFTYMPSIYYIVAIALLIFAMWMFVIKKYSFSATVLSALIFVSGMTVNPVSIGIEAISNQEVNPTLEQIRQEDQDATWIAVDSFYNQNFLLANGIKAINAVNFYPDFEKWELIDENHEYSDVYNRYAHIIITLTDQPTTMDNSTAPDMVNLNLNVQDIKKWNVDYIMSTVDYSNLLDQQNIEYTEVFVDSNNYNRIYKIEEEK